MSILENQTVKGTLHFIGPTENPSQKNPSFRKRRIILETSINTKNGVVPHYLEMEATQEAADALESYHPGQPVICSIDLSGSGKTFQDKKTGQPRAYTTVRLWRIDPQQQQAPPHQQQQQQQGNWQQQGGQQQQNWQQGNTRGGYPDNYNG